jgi:5-methylcytosine-specific restriction protein B
MEAAAWMVLGAGLRGEPSPFDSGVVSWTPENALEAVARIADSPDTSGASFMVKLRGQLEGASRGVVLLVAELLYIQALPLTNVGADTKRKRIMTVLGWLPDAPRIPSAIDAGFEAAGSFNGGTGFNVQVWAQVVWLLRFVQGWTTLAPERQQAALADPDVFAGELRLVRPDSPGIRHSLRYLAWPGWFESIVSTAYLKAIRDAFAYRIGGSSGTDEVSIDRDLRAIRRLLDAEAGYRIEFWQSPYIEQWQKVVEPEGERAWLVRPKPNGSATVARWASEGFVSLVAQYLGEVPGGTGIAEVRSAVEGGYQHLDYAQRLALSREYHAFLSVMKPGDYVATAVDDRFYVGLITGEPGYADDQEARLRRSVDWAAAGAPLAELAPPLPSLLDQQGTVVDLTAAVTEVQRLAGLGGDGPEPPPPPRPPKPAVPALRSATDELASATHLSRSWLQEMIDLLQVRQQIVFYGPPGTGKTYLARELARHLVGADDPSRSRLVQFHPSYAYEDFFEGFRPAEGGSFVLTPGPLRDLAAAALATPGEPFVLIIDEMNRANLAKVFGELYFLLEYRDQAIRLQYRPTEAFRLPPNLYLVGTMNTADRSIALVDAAIRRRFAFVELHPDVDPVRDLLGNFLEANKRPAEPLVGLLRALNAQIQDADRDLRIGPSYLMRSDVTRPGGLERAWRYDILPLLEEHYYGRLSREEIHRTFGLDTLRGIVAAVAPEAADDVAGPVDEDGPQEAGSSEG